MRMVTCSSFVNPSWFLLILGWRDCVHWSCRLEFLHDGFCLQVAWWRVVLSNMPAILMVEGGTFIGSCVKASSPMTLGCHLATMVVHNLMRHHQQSSIDMMFVNTRLPLVHLVILVVAASMRGGVLWLVDLFVQFLWVSAFIVDLVLWPSSSFSLVHSCSGGWVCRFMPNYE